ncbi:MAG: 1-acyl-sn-glycerol-3-phosphate acyltransferase [Gammaproteobacteria bacterium]
MQEFESIRPYRDAEVPAVVRRLLADPKLIAAAAELFTPRLADLLPNVARRIAGLMLKRKARELTTVDEIQRFLAGYFGRLIEKTISELTCTGLDGLKPDRPYLFISNHRDIVMDTGLVNYVLHRAGFETPEAAVGDNLLTEPLVADLMRLNKSFVVERSVTGKRAVYRALTRTSNYIRTALEGRHSVWIAQKEGRSKDGFDRTDPAVVKMLALAWRKEADTFGAWLDRISLVPVAISYELDPCDVQKAHELAVQPRAEGVRLLAPRQRQQTRPSWAHSGCSRPRSMPPAVSAWSRRRAPDHGSTR